MPKGLKPTSGVIVISSGITESAADTFTDQKVDMQLNVLDREVFVVTAVDIDVRPCLLYTSPSPRDGLLSRMPSSA